MNSRSSKIKNVIKFLLLLVVFHFTIGGNLASYISSKYVYKSVEINRLSQLEEQSVYLSSSDYSFLLNTEALGASTQDVKVTTTDPRVLAMRKFLIDHYSPLYAYADTFVVEADKHGLDWRLVASISGVESAFGNLIPFRSNNGWGWRGGPGGAYSIFPTWNDGIAHVTARLAIGYGTDLTPFQIEPVYCPPCGQNPAHAWANGVVQFMNELNFYLENLVTVY